MKRALVVGVANKHSIAWAIARALKAAGWEIGLTYQGERLEKNVRGLAPEVDAAFVHPLDVTDDSQIDALFAEVGRAWGSLDGLVHAVAFAPREALDGRTVETSREAFRQALDVSCYSLIALARRAEPLMKDGGAIVTLSYLGGVRVVPHYNVMGIAKAALEMTARYLAADLGPKGIRVNVVSAGPVKTLAARGISGFSKMLDHVGAAAPLRRNIDVEEVARAAAFLMDAPGVTADVLYVDAGYHALGMTDAGLSGAGPG